MIPSDRARARDGRLAGLWILAPQGLRASPTRSIFVTLTFRVLTPMISTRHGRVQAPLVDRAGRRATATPGYRPVRPDRHRCVRAPPGPYGRRTRRPGRPQDPPPERPAGERGPRTGTPSNSDGSSPAHTANRRHASGHHGACRSRTPRAADLHPRCPPGATPGDTGVPAAPVHLTGVRPARSTPGHLGRAGAARNGPPTLTRGGAPGTPWSDAGGRPPPSA